MPLNLEKIKNIFKSSRQNDEGIGQTQKESRDYSIHGCAFTTASPDIDDVFVFTDGSLNLSSGATTGFASISLPDGATITKAVVYGKADDLWQLKRYNFATGDTWSMLPTALHLNTTSTTFTGISPNFTTPVIDNSKYSYFFTSTFGAFIPDSQIIGARIEYII